MDAELAAGKRRGPLHGVPMAHKDMYYRKGEISTGGSAIRKDWRAPVTATALEKLDAAGVVELGFLNMAEFAAGPTGHNVHHGHCRNPWDQSRVTGGSSSGSGASVAARMVYGALGSDTGGSIRLPAAACGVVGMKATYGRVSRAGAVARSWTSTMSARSPAPCATMRGCWRRSPATIPTIRPPARSRCRTTRRCSKAASPA